MHQARRISRSTNVPLYQQLYDILRDKIMRQEWKPGDMIPPEPDLCDRYGVSRTTVRQVMAKLVDEGLIYRQRGRGTFVARPTLEKAMVRILSFTEDMRERGLEARTQVLSSGLLPAPEYIAERLEVAPQRQLARLERLRLADGEPLSIEEANLVHDYCPGVLQRNYAVVPLREALEQGHGIRLIRAKQVIRAMPASPRVAPLLEIPRLSPLLYIERVSYSQYDVPVEFLRIHYRGDRYSLYNELQG